MGKEKNIAYNNFNLLRIFAALQVVYVHAMSHLNITNNTAIFIKNIVLNFPGVPIFFLVSGYLITMSYDKNKDIRNYLINRLLRIVPGLYAGFIVSVCILFYFDQFVGVGFVDALSWSVAQLTVFQFYNPDFIRGFGVGVINGSLWTISVEVVFYVILPLLFSYLSIDFYKKFLFLVTISMLFYFYIHNVSSNTLIYEKLIKVSIMPYLFYFLFGLCAYKCTSQIEKYVHDKFWLHLSIYIILINVDLEIFIYKILLQVIFSMFVFSVAFSYRNLSYKLIKNIDLTYGTYIYHMLIINVFVQMKMVGSIYTLISVILISIFLGAVSYVLIEKPFLNLKKKSIYHSYLEK
jgi:peptidoglycan/LPS O-acetylase OafA/YrhL